ncbi:hypothetical protein CTEN210_06900 [Chaetoceros tenuissimus]|uniref:DUF6570 domain-containing protein n=1 Tax=Chaetoceros tenuissimus TaxID=426638 RepID=A0AAD3CRD3_9STRA|nr:hypothetical protein CTEN210_06900 [Chaetoceros tenuissimus]
MLNYINAGYHKFPKHELSKSKILEELSKEMVSEEECDKLISSVRSKLGMTYPEKAPEILTCSVCGIKDINREDTRFHRCSISEFGNILQCKEEEVQLFQNRKQKLSGIRLPINEKGDTDKFDLWKLYSRYETEDSNGQYALYYLHPEFVEIDENKKEWIQICTGCYSDLKQNIVPSFSIAKGIDFGDLNRCNLTCPNNIETMCTAMYRLFIKIVRIKESLITKKMSGHAICMQQDDITYNRRDNSQWHILDLLRDNIFILFLSPNGDTDKMMDWFYGSSEMKIRSHVLFQQLTVQKYVNALAQSKKFHYPTYEEIESQLRNFDWKKLKDLQTSYENKQMYFTDESFDYNHVSEIIDEESTNNEETPLQMSYSTVLPDIDILSNASSHSSNDDESDSDSDNNEILQDRENPNISSIRNYLRQVQEALIQPKPFPMKRGSKLANEFIENDKLIAGCFPKVFLFGRAYGKNKGALSTKQTHHLLLQYTMHASHCKELLMFLFNQFLRHNSMRAIVASLKDHNTSEALSEFKKFVGSPDFEDRLAAAIENPTSPEAKHLSKTLLDVLLIHKSDVISGLMTKLRNKSNQYSLMRKYGPQSCFDTISLDLYNNFNIIRASMESYNNTKFPSVCSNPSELVEAAKNGASYEGHDLSYPSRMNYINSNSVAVANEYNHILDTYCLELFGLRFNDTQSTGEKVKKTDNILNRAKGVYGTIYEMCGATDVTKGGKLHAHLLLWKAINSEVLTRFSKDEKLTQKISEIINSQFNTHYHPAVLIYFLLDNFIREIDPFHTKYPHLRAGHLITPLLMTTPLSLQTKEGKQFCEIHSSRAQMHLHKSRCEEGKHGKDGCAGNYPRPTKDIYGPIVLTGSENDNGDLEVSIHALYPDTLDSEEENSEEQLPPSNKTPIEILEDIFTKKDEVVKWDTYRPQVENLPATDDTNAMIDNIMNIVKEFPMISTIVESILKQMKTNEDLHRFYSYLRNSLPDCNGLVVAHNNTISLAFGIEGSKDIKHALSILAYAHEMYEKHGSQGTDSGLDQKVRVLLEKVYNKITSYMEFSEFLVASFLLGGTQLLCTQEFRGINVNDHVVYTARCKDFDSNRQTTKDTLAIRKERDEYAGEPCNSAVYRVYNPSKDSDYDLCSSPYPSIYSFRGFALWNLSRKELTENTQFKQIPIYKETKKNTIGRSSNK